ncbi:MAG: protein translocase subunit SecF [Candidatus Acidulodesulfobacterium ferriphilum]|uniref:Protein-export membrane protein SecF n=1 Tax=Candidatus Acidulodesulfobacterium ferriphilum TaxID=2597223 RepID=A0A519BC92_9DELT|nr:MAG: protein translocase subunit SecF [Candidatus Acidulodesulfobacterium ferriphilum]
MEFIKNTNFNFIGKKKYSFVLSSILVVLGLIELITMILGTARIGIDFTGGLSLQLSFQHKISVADVRKELLSKGFKDVKIVKIKGKNDIIIQTKAVAKDLNKYTDEIKTTVQNAFKNNPSKVLNNEMIGPSVGKKLAKDAIVAIIISIIAIILYITWRFEFRFGLAAAIGLAHDVLALMGIIFIFQKEITLLVITAILTVAGYSLTDKVVVFDRIRENLKKRAEKTEQINLNDLVNKSINEVLTRTVVTSLTVILVVLSLFFLGGIVLHDFAFTLLWGVLIGTYSSIFIASPVMIMLNENK